MGYRISPRGLTFLTLLLAQSFTTAQYNCLEEPERNRTKFHFSGTALGGWLVLEPWITPSLFYQFLGATSRYGSDTPSKVAMDGATFCTALGAMEANRQLKIHWKNWVSEDQIRDLASAGVDHVRVPVGDWMFVPYEPFIGCWDGAIDELNRVIDLCAKYNIGVLIDIHGMKGSQNGYDNSGQAKDVVWNTSDEMFTSFDHWDYRSGSWAGTYDIKSQEYTSINYSNINRSLLVVKTILETYASNPTVIGLEPANEPWQPIPLEVVQKYYWNSYRLVRQYAPTWITLFHDSFRFNIATWGNFAEGCPNFAIDTHIYQVSTSLGMELVLLQFNIFSLINYFLV